MWAQGCDRGFVGILYLWLRCAAGIFWHDDLSSPWNGEGSWRGYQTADRHSVYKKWDGFPPRNLSRPGRCTGDLSGKLHGQGSACGIFRRWDWADHRYRCAYRWDQKCGKPYGYFPGVSLCSTTGADPPCGRCHSGRDEASGGIFQKWGQTDRGSANCGANQLWCGNDEGNRILLRDRELFQAPDRACTGAATVYTDGLLRRWFFTYYRWVP